jgi:hypothetical protein
MLGHVQSPDYEPTARRSICAACRKPSIAHEETDNGPLCRKCVSSATAIRVDYVINGQVFTKRLKSALVVAPRLKFEKK